MTSQMFWVCLVFPDCTETFSKTSKVSLREKMARRRRVKKGTVRRLLSNCTYLAAAIGVLAVGSIGSCAKLFQNGFLGDTRPDVIEIFGGHAEVSLQFARKGWSVSQPIDEIYGCDLKDSAERQKVLDLVRSQRPSLLIISWPCKYRRKLSI